jgi:hypothetical protein
MPELLVRGIEDEEGIVLRLDTGDALLAERHIPLRRDGALGAFTAQQLRLRRLGVSPAHELLDGNVKSGRGYHGFLLCRGFLLLRDTIYKSRSLFNL